MKYYYPAIFAPKGEGLEGYTLRFPDIPGCFTMGDDIDECLWMAQRAIGLMLDDVDEKNYPAPSEIGDIDLSEYPEGSFVSIVCFDKEKYDADTKNPIKAASEYTGLNIKELSDILHAPYRTVQKWISGKTRPKPWVERLVVEKIYSEI